MPDENPESKSLLSPWCPWYWSACTNNRWHCYNQAVPLTLA
jgi:hypothetical protein